MSFGVKPEYGEKNKLCYMDTDSFIASINTDGSYSDIAEDDETRFDTSDYELHKPLTKGKNKKVIGLIKAELGGKIMNQFAVVRAKTYSYLTDNNNEDKKGKEKTFHLKRKVKFEDYRHRLETTQLRNKVKVRLILIILEKFLKNS